MKSGFGRFRYGLYQVCNTQTMQTIANQMLRFAHGLGLVCIHIDLWHVPRQNEAKSRANSLHSKADWRPSAGQYVRSSSNELPNARRAQRYQQDGGGQKHLSIFALAVLVGALRKPCYPLLSSLLPHPCAGMQAGGGNPQVCASLGLRNVCKTDQDIFF